MASVTLRNTGDTWTPGTSLGIYPASNFPMAAPPEKGRAPLGSAAATASSDSSGNVTFTGLADATKYVVTDATGSRYVRVSTPKPGDELLARAKLASDVTGITSTSYVDVTGLSVVTITAPTEPITLAFYTPQVLNGTAGRNVTIGFFSGDNATQYGVDMPFQSALAFSASPLAAEVVLDTLTPGAQYSFKVRVKVDAGSGKIGQPGYFEVRRDR